MPKKVIIAMSGGVDSSVSAALLKRAGFDVEGVFLKLCRTAKFAEAAQKAGKVAKILKIPFRILDLQREFKKKIIDYSLKEYQADRTPNPCVVCNKEIKFGSLLKLGADFIATGHYARVKNGRLLRGKDKNKDQSYFLWRLNQAQLKRILFPLGNYTKDEVRKLARRFKLPVFDSPESQDICFNLPSHMKFYTVGQRKGLGLSGGPYWVLGRDSKKSLILTKNEKDLYNKELVFKEANWLSPKSGKIKAKIRYRAKLASGKFIEPNRFVFDQPQRAITPGQSVVFYKGSQLLGGAVID